MVRIPNSTSSSSHDGSSEEMIRVLYVPASVTRTARRYRSGLSALQSFGAFTVIVIYAAAPDMAGTCTSVLLV